MFKELIKTAITSVLYKLEILVQILDINIINYWLFLKDNFIDNLVMDLKFNGNTMKESWYET